MEYKDKITVVFNSKNRTLPSPLENPLFTLETPIERVKGIELESVAIPYSFYLVRDGNYYIRTPSFSTNITKGTYTCSSLASAIQSTIRTSGWSDFVCSYSSASKKFTLSRNTIFTIYLDSNSVFKNIGFSQDLSGATSYISEVPISDININIINRNNSFSIQYPYPTTATLDMDYGSYNTTDFANLISDKTSNLMGLTTSLIEYKQKISFSSSSTIQLVTNSISDYKYNFNKILNVGVADTNTQIGISGTNIETLYVFDKYNTCFIKIKSSIVQYPGTNLMFAIPVCQSSGEYITNNMQKSEVEFQNIINISEIDFRLTNDVDEMLNLNGVEWSISVTFNIC